MESMQIIGVLLISFVIVLVMQRKASAHCDTMDGPTAIDGKKALETNNLNYALKWTSSEFDEELKGIFELSVKVRTLSPEAQTVADRYFLENLVRIHRAGEGAPFTGLKPSGVPIDEKVLAADKSIEIGNLSPLEGMVPKEEMHELEERFEKVLELKDFDVNDVKAGREYIEAYIQFFKFAEGEEEHAHGHHGHGNEHGNEHGHGHGHGHGHHA